MSDGYCEGMGDGIEAGIGAVLIDTASCVRETFGQLLSKRGACMLAEECNTHQLIAQAELISVFIARVAWSQLLSRSVGRRVLHSTDNDAARFRMIKGAHLHEPLRG